MSFLGLWWSSNGGASWDHDQITHNPHTGVGATILALAVNSNGVIFAGGFRSTNSGNTWLDLGFHGYSFEFDSAENTYAGSRFGVRVSFDEGATWTPVNAGMETENVRALALNSSFTSGP